MIFPSNLLWVYLLSELPLYINLSYYYYVIINYILSTSHDKQQTLSRCTVFASRKLKNKDINPSLQKQ